MENETKRTKSNTANMKRLLADNPQAVIEEINNYLSTRNITSIQKEWNDSFLKEKYNSYSAFTRELNKYGYSYSRKDKKFIKEQSEQQESCDNSSNELLEIIKSFHREKHKCENKTIRIDVDTYNEFNELANEFSIPKSEFTTLMYKKFIADLKEALKQGV